MEWISVGNMTNDNAPEGKVLIQYLEPSWGFFSREISTGYYDNPNDYEPATDGEGWKFWDTNRNAIVTHYALLPAVAETEFNCAAQSDVLSKYDIVLGMLKLKS